MVDRFIKIRDHLERMAETQGIYNVLNVPNSFVFRTRCLRIAKRLKEVDYITQELLKKGANLEQCRFALDALITSVTKFKNIANSSLYLCSLQNDYISLPSIYYPNSCFELGVEKIQRNQLDNLTENKNEACSKLDLPGLKKSRAVIQRINQTIKCRRIK